MFQYVLIFQIFATDRSTVSILLEKTDYKSFTNVIESLKLCDWKQ